MSPSMRRDTTWTSPWCRSACRRIEETSSGICIMRPFMGISSAGTGKYRHAPRARSVRYETMTVDKDDPLQKILSHPLLRDLPERTLGGLRELVVRRNVRAGTHVFTKGGQPPGWYGIVNGEVRIVTSAPNGTEIVLTILEGGDWFGEVAILAERPNSHDAVARVDTDLAFVPATSFRHLLAREPELYSRLVALMGQRVQFLVDVI